MTNKQLARELRSAASALEHGRNRTARRKVVFVTSQLLRISEQAIADTLTREQEIQMQEREGESEYGNH